MADYFNGGVRLKQHKSELLKLPIACDGYEGELSVVVDSQAQPAVNVGAQVCKNNCIAVGGNAAWYSPCDGILTGIEPYSHPIAGEVNIYKISPRTEGRLSIPAASDDGPAFDMLIDTLDGSPLADKLAGFAARGVKLLAVNAIDDQPYTCPDTALVLERHEEILQGLSIIAAKISARPYGAVYFRTKAADGVAKLRREDVIEVGGKYPYAYRYCRAHEKNTGFIGAQTCIDALNALHSLQRQTQVVVTVSGDKVAAPRNLWVKLGTPIKALLERCGYSGDGVVVVGDGPMTGKYVSDLSAPVCLGMKSVIGLQPAGLSAASNCWGCAECAKVCPERLMPHYIARFARHGRYEDAANFGADRCTGCGCCSYVCSGGVEPMPFILEAKAVIHSDMPQSEKRLPVVGLRLARSAASKEKKEERHE